MNVTSGIFFSFPKDSLEGKQIEKFDTIFEINQISNK